MLQIFNGNKRGPGGAGKSIYIQLDVSFRSKIKHFKNAQLATFLAIALHMDKDGVAFPSYDTLERETGYKRGAVAKALKDLCKMEIDGSPVLMKWRDRDDDGKFIGSNRYKIFPTAEEVQSSQSGSQSAVKRTVGSSQSSESELEVIPSFEEDAPRNESKDSPPPKNTATGTALKNSDPAYYNAIRNRIAELCPMSPDYHVEEAARKLVAQSVPLCGVYDLHQFAIISDNNSASGMVDEIDEWKSELEGQGIDYSTMEEFTPPSSSDPAAIVEPVPPPFYAVGETVHIYERDVVGKVTDRQRDTDNWWVYFVVDSDGHVFVEPAYELEPVPSENACSNCDGSPDIPCHAKTVDCAYHADHDAAELPAFITPPDTSTDDPQFSIGDWVTCSGMHCKVGLVHPYDNGWHYRLVEKRTGNLKDAAECELESQQLAPAEPVAKAKKKQKANPHTLMYDALIAAFGWSADDVPKPMRGQLNTASKDLRELEIPVTPDDIGGRNGLHAFTRRTLPEGSNFGPRALSNQVAEWRKQKRRTMPTVKSDQEFAAPSLVADVQFGGTDD